MTAPLALQRSCPWPVGRCTRCGEPVIWATTSTGKALPVNPVADRAGSIVLTTTPGDLNGRPSVTDLRSLADRSRYRAGSIYRSHLQTCTQRTQPRSEGARA